MQAGTSLGGPVGLAVPFLEVALNRCEIGRIRLMCLHFVKVVQLRTERIDHGPCVGPLIGEPLGHPGRELCNIEAATIAFRGHQQTKRTMG
eukprot:9370390-Pyramimonas_sp.AAC.1